MLGCMFLHIQLAAEANGIQPEQTPALFRLILQKNPPGGRH